MPGFDIQKSLVSAQRRLQAAPFISKRRPRSDRGRTRIDPKVRSWLAKALSGYERPKIAKVLVQIGERCRREGLTPPSRATIYKLLDTLPTPTYRLATLPRAVRSALYNLDDESQVPGHQVAFYCFNYGDIAAMSFASGLPWLALHQALRLPGYRTKSRGLVEAVTRARGI